MMGRRWRQERLSERGAAAVEFAFIAPILVFLLFGIVGVGWMLSFRQAMGQAASEGARAAAVAPKSLPDGGAGDNKRARAVDAVNAALSSYGVQCAGSALIYNNTNSGTCTIMLNSSCTGTTTAATCAKVELDYLYRDHSLLPAVPGLGLVLPRHLRYTSEVEINR